MKPTIIYVSGAPGSGKTTLAKLLAEQLYIDYISSDMVKGGLEFTQANHDRTASTTGVFVPLLVDHAQKGISFVADHVLQKDIARSTVIDELKAVANVIYIHTQANDPIGRYTERVQQSEIPDIIRRRELLLERANHHRDNLVNTAEVIDLGVPTLVVNTDDGYAPNIDEILNFIKSQ
ncbi:MAG: AAA family ATPase [Candidatus Microsaccharimonas sp.]